MDRSQALQLGAESASVEAKAPDRDAMVAEFGKDSHVTMPDGSWRVYSRRPDLTQYENDLRGKRMVEMMRDRNEKAREVSLARDARSEKVAYIASDGHVSHVSPQDEHEVARKGGKPIIRWGRPSLRHMDGRWWRRVGKDWVPE